eukprot:3220200-Lingulodinium_polyedra.AAC.1
MHAIVTEPRASQSTHSVRRPPYGGRRVECANCEMCGVAVVECVSERSSEQLSRERCSDMRLGVHPIVAVPRISQ